MSIQATCRKSICKGLESRVVLNIGTKVDMFNASITLGTL
jgi:hypothetical protein